MTPQRELAGRMDIFADDFGVAPGLEVVMRHLDGGLVMITVRYEGATFESYRPVPVDNAVAAVGYLIRGSAPPRGLFRPGRPVG